MKQRLVRALQRGGVTAEIRPDIWGVWRGRDRRRRMIGELPGREIDLLKLNAHLTPVGDPYHVVMTWNQTAGRRAPFKMEPSAPRSLLNHLILTCPSPARRQAFSHAAQALRQDFFQTTDKSASHCEKATKRLASIRRVFSDPDQTFVSALVLGEASKSDLAKTCALRPDAIETKARSVLRTLARIYG